MNLVDAWIAYQETGNEQYWWAIDRIDELMENAPEACWEFILEAMDKSFEKDKVFACLAAGPLENFIHQWGEEYLEVIYLKTRQDPKFNQLLGGVWGLEELKAVWEKLSPIMNHKW